MPHQPAPIFAAQAKFHHGPLPPADELANYDRTLSGAADRIIRMAEQQAQHRQHIERDSLAGDQIARQEQLAIERGRIVGTIWSERIGQLFGFAIAAGCLGGAFWGMTHDRGVATIGLFLGIPILSVVKAFLSRPQAGGAEEKKSAQRSERRP